MVPRGLLDFHLGACIRVDHLVANNRRHKPGPLAWPVIIHTGNSRQQLQLRDQGITPFWLGIIHLNEGGNFVEQRDRREGTTSGVLRDQGITPFWLGIIHLNEGGNFVEQRDRREGTTSGVLTWESAGTSSLSAAAKEREKSCPNGTSYN
jgi:hypothetical protein